MALPRELALPVAAAVPQVGPWARAALLLVVPEVATGRGGSESERGGLLHSCSVQMPHQCQCQYQRQRQPRSGPGATSA